mmetsp:Transcript_120809/g.233142  ORF Transcript_120809/g.233142 Transcript_120809/m.233142 type:complete len:163 (-) Transcript_120809:2-490(-)
MESCWLPGAEAGQEYGEAGMGSCTLPGAGAGTGSCTLPGTGALATLESPGCAAPGSGYPPGAGAYCCDPSSAYCCNPGSAYCCDPGGAYCCDPGSAYCCDPLIGACNCIGIALDGPGGGCNPPSIDMDGLADNDAGANILERCKGSLDANLKTRVCNSAARA